MNFHMSVSVPHGVSNKAFRSSFTGIYDIAMNVNAQVFKGFMAGIQFRTNDWKTADIKYQVLIPMPKHITVDLELVMSLFVQNSQLPLWVLLQSGV